LLAAALEQSEHVSDQSGAQPSDARGAASLTQILARESSGHPLDVVTELVHVGNVCVQALADLEVAAQDSRGTRVGFTPRGRAMASTMETELDAADAGEHRGDGEPRETIDVDHTIVGADDGRTHRALTPRCRCCLRGCTASTLRGSPDGSDAICGRGSALDNPPRRIRVNLGDLTAPAA
jgi:hypothetical protein